jgi:hypothetical protein
MATSLGTLDDATTPTQTQKVAPATFQGFEPGSSVLWARWLPTAPCRRLGNLAHENQSSKTHVRAKFFKYKLPRPNRFQHGF